MAQWATDDGPVLATVARLLRDRDHVSDALVLAELGWGPNRHSAVKRSMKLLIDSDFLVGRPLTAGDGTIMDVTVTSVTEKGLQRLGLWTDQNQELVAALIAALNDAAAKAKPEEATRLRKAAHALEGVGRDVLVGVLVGVVDGFRARLGLP